MKLGRLISKTTSFPTQFPPFRNAISGLTWYSTQGNSGLYRRMFPVGVPTQSAKPVLDQWVQEGQTVTQHELRVIIKQLRRYRRFNHALEVSQWMSDKRFMQLAVGDVAIRLDLIAKVHGIEEAEDYFNNIPKQNKTIEVHGALLNCYAHAKCEDKADVVMHKMKEFGVALNTVNYNVMLNLYCKTGNHQKVDAVIHEMETNDIKFDRITYGILLNVSGANSDADKIEKILRRIESDAEFNIDWAIYADVANRFLRAGFEDKALESLRKSEKLVALGKKKNDAFAYLLTLYAAAGKKEEVLRMWNECKKLKPCNRDYIAILSSILKFDELETAENIFKEWKASDLSKDIRIPNFLVGFYCRKGLVEKAEALIESMKLVSWEPNASTWYWMSLGYFQSNQMQKAVEAMESALLKRTPTSRWKHDKENMVACLKYLKEEGDVDRSGNFVGLLKDKGIITEEIHHKLLAYFSGEYAFEDGLFGNFLGGDEDCAETLN
nr:pentatricopeptide repeat-containing protein At2g20710, mitochondrial-like isoform X1 [Spinacia oleracea]